MPDKFHIFPRAAYVAKAITVVGLTLLGGGAAGLIVGAPAAWIVIAIGALQTVGVYRVPNGPKPEVD